MESDDLGLHTASFLFGGELNADEPFARHVVFLDGSAYSLRQTKLGALRAGFVCLTTAASGTFSEAPVTTALRSCSDFPSSWCIDGYNVATLGGEGNCSSESHVGLKISTEDLRRLWASPTVELEVSVHFVKPSNGQAEVCSVNGQALKPLDGAYAWTYTTTTSYNELFVHGTADKCSGISMVTIREKLPQGDPSCWSHGYTYQRCCLSADGDDCWSAGFSRERCCSSARVTPVPPQAPSARGAAPCVHPYCWHDCIGPPPAYYEQQQQQEEHAWPEPLVCDTYSIYPLWFTVLPENIVQCIPLKTVDLAPIFPGHTVTYVYENTVFGAQEYFRTLRSSFFAIAGKRSGWESRRVQEILSSGSVPLFLGLDGLPNNTMKLYPRHLLRAALELPGVAAGRIQDGFDMDRYLDIASQLLVFTKQRLVAGHLVDYIFNVTGYGGGPVLLLHRAEAVLHLAVVPAVAELRRRLGPRLVDFPGVADAFLYDAPRPPRGSRVEEERPHKYYNHRAVAAATGVERSAEAVAQQLSSRAFALVIIPELRWGGIDEGLLQLALRHYGGRQLVFLDDCDNGFGTAGELMKDAARRGTLFMREMPEVCT